MEQNHSPEVLKSIPQQNGEAESSNAAQDRAARVIQRHYRGHADRKRVKNMHMDQQARWDDLMKQSEAKGVAEDQLDNKNDVKSRWARGLHAAKRLQTGDGLHSAPGRGSALAESRQDDIVDLDDETRKARRATFWGKLTIPAGKERDDTEELPYHSKAMEQQHWLEMIDGKHRYGSNLKYYFRKWKESETDDNFFRLDRGGGKDLDLEELPRERLESERITYLSAEQRLNYLVKVDKDGKLRWVHSGEYVDTAAGKWRDGGADVGIVEDDSWSDPSIPEEDLPDNPTRRRRSSSSILSSMSSTYSADSSALQDNEDTHYAGYDYKREEERSWLDKKLKGITPAGVRRQILKKTVRRNTWIYVSDVHMNMFIGIKQTGKFQHSSFLGGGKVTSAGIIVVKQGVIKSMNPWSGHYRSTIQAYRSYIAQLENKGTDLSHVKIGKSVMMIWGLSKYTKATKKPKDLTARFKATLGLAHEPTEKEKSKELEENAQREEQEHQDRLKAMKVAEDAEDTPDAKARARREVLYGRKKGGNQANEQDDVPNQSSQ